MVCRNNEASRSFLVSLLADWLDDWFSLIPHSNEAEEEKVYNGQKLFLKVYSRNISRVVKYDNFFSTI